MQSLVVVQCKHWEIVTKTDICSDGWNYCYLFDFLGEEKRRKKDIRAMEDNIQQSNEIQHLESSGFSELSFSMIIIIIFFFVP